MFDGSKRLIVANSLFAELYGIAAEAIRPGMDLHEIVSLRVAAGSLPKTAQEDWLEWRKHVVEANRPSDSDVELCNGRIIHIRHEPLSDDGWVATHKDVTEQRRAEDELRPHLSPHFQTIPNASEKVRFSRRSC